MHKMRTLSPLTRFSKSTYLREFLLISDEPKRHFVIEPKRHFVIEPKRHFVIIICRIWDSVRL